MNEENKYILELKEVITGFLGNEDVKIILFGSRARKDNNVCSDIDIGIIPYGKFEEKNITLLKEKTEDLNIPYKVEIINFQNVSQDFKNLALKDAVVWKD